MHDIPLAEQIAAVEQAARATRRDGEQSTYPAERAIILRRADALDAAANSLRLVGAHRKTRRGPRQ